MAKSVKKKNRKLRRQIRKTCGALLMASAIAVAAIPVSETQARVDVVEKNKVVVMSEHPITGYTTAKVTYNSTIPFASDVPDARKNEKIVYTSENGFFQFVYIRPTATNPNRVAMILNYTGSETSLTIPDRLEGYRKYRDNDTSSGYCLVSKNNEYLHYMVRRQKEIGQEKYYLVSDIMAGANKLEVSESQCQYREVDGVMTLVYVTNETQTVYPTPLPTPTADPSGNAPAPEPDPTPYEEPYEIIHLLEPSMIDEYMPCYNTTKEEWQDVPAAELYYSMDKVNFSQCGNDDDHQRINADVAFIGQETLKDNGYGSWEVDAPITRPEQGVFANNPSLTYLTIGDNMQGIGDFAFYGCSTLQELSFSPKLETVGNGAFAECIRLTKCDLAYNSNLLALGKDAFYNCRSLQTFYTNVGLLAIGDSCFEGCNHLTNIYLSGESSPTGAGEVALKCVGNHVFKDCAALSCVEFPYSYGEIEPLEFDMFAGCSSLQYVKISNEKINFDIFHKDDKTNYPRCEKNDWKDILADLPNSFYFEGPDVSAIHDTCKEQSIAFKYLNSEPALFEIKVFEKDKDDTGDAKTAEVTYQIHTDGSIYKVIINGKPLNLTIPETIGPYGIDTIGAGAFSNNCYLTRVTIPASCNAIEENAFKGCHNLETVVFTDATKVESIGGDAFRTQACMYTGSGTDIKCEQCKESLNYPTAELVFCGAMINAADNTDTVPFKYAMNGVSSINNGDQTVSWISYHSGWPTNMVVQYDYNAVTREGVVELIDYPRFSDYRSVGTSDEYLDSLPYVTEENKAYYSDLISKAVDVYTAYVKDPVHNQAPTDNQMELINSALNIVIPSNVDAIKTGIFSGVDNEGQTVTGTEKNTEIQTITLNGVKELEPYTFANCSALTGAYIIGPTYIGDYCFDADDSLTNVSLSTNLEDTGRRPFSGCENLTDIECLGANFRYDNGILYRNLNNGEELVECLEGRGDIVGSYTVNANETANVSAIKPEAFKNCNEIGKVDLSKATFDILPEECFSNASNLNSVILPTGMSQIDEGAFWDTTSLKTVMIPYSVIRIEQDAFANKENGSKEYPNSFNDAAHVAKQVIVSCVEGSTVDKYAKSYIYLKPEYGDVFITHYVYFYDDFDSSANPKLLDKQIVNDGDDAVPPEEPDHESEGYVFVGWSNYTDISKDTDVFAKYAPVGDKTYAIDFLDYDGKKLCETQYITEGKNATPPADPVREGFTFVGWQPSNYIGVYEDAVIVAQYKDNSGDAERHNVSFYSSLDGSLIVSQKVNHGEAAIAPGAPNVSGYTFVRWVPSDFSEVTQDMNILGYYEKNTGEGGTSPAPGGTSPAPSGSATASPNASASASPTATPNPADSVKKYTVSVSGGSGSGSYAAGEVVAINAYDMGTGQVFDKWTTSTAGVGFANANATSTTFTMPAANVSITATYKTGNSASTASASSGTNSTNSTASRAANGTTVEVTKPGISNTNLAGATVSGATDNFVVKVTEDDTAAQAATAALQARYGDLSRIKYFPMDISLYDSEGRTKIADTSGISVNLTLPLPDDLIQYAGNNKMAAIANGALEDLNTRFTTVDGVPCVNFTATHFSPYVIYVDTANLTQPTIDATPKTGDPIHPKWFLAIGLACISLILFFKRDKVTVKAA